MHALILLALTAPQLSDLDDGRWPPPATVDAVIAWGEAHLAWAVRRLDQEWSARDWPDTCDWWGHRWSRYTDTVEGQYCREVESRLLCWRLLRNAQGATYPAEVKGGALLPAEPRSEAARLYALRELRERLGAIGYSMGQLPFPARLERFTVRD